MRFSQLRRHRSLGISPFLGLASTFGVCERTFPAFDRLPWVGTSNTKYQLKIVAFIPSVWLSKNFYT